MKYFRKSLIVLTAILTITLFSTAKVYSNDPTYSFNSQNTYTTYGDVLNTYMEGVLEIGSFSNKIKLNMFDFDLEENNLHMVPVSYYNDFAWGMSPMTEKISQFERDNPHLTVVAAINGDFYDINNTGRSTSNHMEDYRLIKGIPTNRNIVQFMEDGSTRIGVAKRDGYEVLVFNEFNEIKFRQKLDGLNNASLGNDKVGLYLEEADITNINNLDTFKVLANDIKRTNTNLESAVGHVATTDEISDISSEQFVITGSALTGIVEEGDRVVIQVNMLDFENVRATVGGNQMLVANSQVTDLVKGTDWGWHSARAPRTALGIREDGSVFWMVSNGRDTEEEVPGLSLRETGEFMKSQGAVTALNLDGGGSSTMLVRQADGTFKFLNKLSDGRERAVSNGVLLVKGDIPEKPINIQGLAERPVFNTPQNLALNADNVLRFDPVAGATRYFLELNGKRYEIARNEFDLNILGEGEHKIRVYTKGNLANATSSPSEEITVRIKFETTQEIIEWLKDYAKNTN